MELTNEFTVDVPVEDAWSVLTDLVRIAPCMPGAKLEEAEGDEYRGKVKVKVGPVTAEYRGTAKFLEQDAAARRAVLRAEGRETRGQGNAAATITATLEAVPTGTQVKVVTDLTITGRVAQFGRGVLAEVSNKLLGQFVQSLETTVLAGLGSEPAEPDGAPASPASGGEASGGDDHETDSGAAGDGAASGNGHGSTGEKGASRSPGTDPPATAGSRPALGGDDPEAIDLGRVVGPVLLKRLGPVAGAAVVAWALWRWRRRR